ncbi:MAG: AraC family ligand binding domain-containing protein [Methylobacterium sp.]|nr:AraC family ligand binding domain-containing protein [Methylobacterium ajmalii]MBZ6416278.1 AraC family ligand binding domain-containing protein [Methylobacterium sp.]
MPGLEAVSVSSDRAFPRHAHDHFGFGVVATGAHRSWSGLGAVEAVAGDIITVNPGEIHDGLPVRSAVRALRMAYLDPSRLADLLPDERRKGVEFARPALRDPALARGVTGLFGLFAMDRPDPLAVEQELVRVLVPLFARFGSRPAPRRGPPPPGRCDGWRRRPKRPVPLAELAGLSGVSRFQFLCGSARAVGTTPHAYLGQQRVRLARRLLAAGSGPDPGRRRPRRRRAAPTRAT